jgi:hypothetical protein
MEQSEELRPTYKGELRRSLITDKYEPYYPSWKRLIFRLFVTIPTLIINIVLVSCVILLIIRFQSWIDRQLKAGRLPRMNRLFEESIDLKFLLNRSHVINGFITENFISISHNAI